MSAQMKHLSMTVDNLRESLSEYSVLKGLGSKVTLDNVLEVQEDLMTRMGTSEGFKNEHISIMIRHGEPLPALYELRTFESAIADVMYEVKVMSILGMSWTPDNYVVVDILGTKHVLRSDHNTEGGEIV